MRNAATQSTIRINNQELIIEYILANGSVSRAELSKALSISKPTVSTNVEGLLSKNILVELGEGNSSGGRKPTLLNFNYDHRVILAIDLNRNEPLIALSNLSGEIIKSVSIVVGVEDDKPILIQKLTSAINALILEEKYTLDVLGAISIAIPGVINEESGEVFANPQFNLWRKLNLKTILTDIYHVPVILKNDISMAALGEKHYGMGRDVDDLIYVSIGLGVGAGLIINGQLFEGKRKAAGEIGYSRLLGPANHAHLEDIISTDVLRSRIIQDVDAGQETCLDMTKTSRLNIDAIKQALKDKDVYSMGLLQEVGTLLGTAVANTALILDLEMIIIGGVLSEIGKPLIQVVQKTVDEILPFETQVKETELGKMAGLYGLLEIAKERIMEDLVE